MEFKKNKRWGKVWINGPSETQEAATLTDLNESVTNAPTTNRAAIKISQDQNFDDIYNRRFRKYCMLLAKEKELLRRLGKVRAFRNARSTVYNITEQEFVLGEEEEEESENYRSISGKRYGSLKELRYVRPPIACEQYKRLSTSYENVDAELQDGESNSVGIMVDSLTPPGSKTSFPNANHHQQHSYHGKDVSPQNDRNNKFEHAASFDSGYVTSTRRSTVYTRTQSFDTQEVTEMMSLISDPPLHRSSSAKYSMTSFQRNRYSTSSVRELRHDTDYAVRLSKSTSVKSLSESPSLESLGNFQKNTIMTSSTRDLTDRNVRDIRLESKNLRMISPILQKRLAEANIRKQKRDEVLKGLDDDFNKAKVIMEKYKSSENLTKYKSNEIVDMKKSKSTENLLAKRKEKDPRKFLANLEQSQKQESSNLNIQITGDTAKKSSPQFKEVVSTLNVELKVFSPNKNQVVRRRSEKKDLLSVEEENEKLVRRRSWTYYQ